MIAAAAVAQLLDGLTFVLVAIRYPGLEGELSPLPRLIGIWPTEIVKLLLVMSMIYVAHRRLPLYRVLLLFAFVVGSAGTVLNVIGLT